MIGASGTSGYHLSYTYDQGGKRTMKIDQIALHERYEVEYHYDIEPDTPRAYLSRNNRLMEAWTYHVTPPWQVSRAKVTPLRNGHSPPFLAPASRTRVPVSG